MSARPPPDAEAVLALAHALRTPLTSLALGLGLLEDGTLGPLADAQREVVRDLVAEVERLSRLVRNELRIEHLGVYTGPLERGRTDLSALVERAAAPLIEQARERGVTIAIDLAPGVQGLVDPVKMGWVVASLIGNALRYSPRGAEVAVRLAAAGKDAEIRIRDEGPGMTAEVAARVFDRGGGLGLLLAREIVEAHGGTIRVESKEGAGATFILELPAAGAGEGHYDEQEG